MPMEMPTSFGPHAAYRVVEEIGKGGFATVYKAYHDALDRYVAIKVLRPEILGDEQGRERFVREARIAARLGGHPNIVTIYDYGEQDGLAYLILEYIEGTTLQKRLAQTISFAEIERVVEGVSSALDFAHSRQLVHRDVKEANVLFGSDGRVLLSDFGIAKLLNAMTPVTATMVGTPEYMSPEQVLSAQVDGRSDIYALGAMVYRMFSGRPPFVGSPLSILHQHVHETPPPLTSATRPIPPGVNEIVQKALAKNPAGRYASAGELTAELSKALRPAIEREQASATPSGTPVPIPVGQTPRPPRPTPTGQPQPPLTPTSVGQVQLQPTLTPTGTSRPSLPRIPPPMTPPPRAPAPQPPAGARRWILAPLVALLLLLVGGVVMLRPSLFGADVPATRVPTSPPTTAPSTAAPTQAGAPPTAAAGAGVGAVACAA